MTRFRGLLLSTIALGVLALSASRPAHAQMAVFDGATFGELVDEAQNGARQLEQLQQEVAVSRDQLTRLTTFYQSFAHATNVTELSGILDQSSTIMPLPQLASIEGMLRGQGFTGSLASRSTVLLSQIQQYHPASADPAAVAMNSTASATAAQMAAAEALYSSASQRQQGMSDLMNGLAGSHDPKQSLDLQARATIENGYAATQTNQALSLQVMQRAQADAEQEQAAQQYRAGADSLAQQASALVAANADDGP